MRPKTALTLAATNAAPTLSLYDATTRGSLMVCQIAFHPIVAVRSRQRHERHEHDQTQVEHRESQREPEARQHAGASAFRINRVIPRTF